MDNQNFFSGAEPVDNKRKRIIMITSIATIGAILILSLVLYYTLKNKPGIINGTTDKTKLTALDRKKIVDRLAERQSNISESERNKMVNNIENFSSSTITKAQRQKMMQALQTNK